MKTILWGIALLLAFGVGLEIQPSTPHMINIHAEEDLSDPPIVEPISALIITRSAGWVCYANDKARIDPTQYYVDCATAINLGAKLHTN